jgi:hypothetical protein
VARYCCVVRTVIRPASASQQTAPEHDSRRRRSLYLHQGIPAALPVRAGFCGLFGQRLEQIIGKTDEQFFDIDTAAACSKTTSAYSSSAGADEEITQPGWRRNMHSSQSSCRCATPRGAVTPCATYRHDRAEEPEHYQYNWPSATRSPVSPTAACYDRPTP